MKNVDVLHIKVPSARKKALWHLAIERGSSLNEVTNLAIEKMLENDCSKIEIWLPDKVNQWLISSNRDLYDIVRKELATEIVVACQNGELAKEKAFALVSKLGFKSMDEVL